jgi:AcrR family transcriptional regulator
MKQNFSRRQKQIVDTTMSIIREKGLVSATTRNIAGRLGIKEPSLYRHFTNKEAIFEGMCEVVEDSYRQLAEDMKSVEGSVLEQISAAFLLRSKLYDQNPDLACILLNAEMVFQAYPELLERMKLVRKADYKLLVQAVKEAQKKGMMKKELKAENIATMIAGSFAAIVNNYWGSSGSVLSLCKSVWKDLEKALYL